MRAESLQSCPTHCNTVDSRIARQTPLSKGFSRQKYWSGSPCPPPGRLPNPRLFMPLALAGRFFTTSTTWEARTGIPITQINSVNAWNNRSGFCFLH